MSATTIRNRQWWQEAQGKPLEGTGNLLNAWGQGRMALLSGICSGPSVACSSLTCVRTQREVPCRWDLGGKDAAVLA